VFAPTVEYRYNDDLIIKEIINQRHKLSDDTPSHGLYLGMGRTKAFENKQTILKGLYLFVKSNRSIY